MTLDDWLLNLRQAAPADRPALMLQLSDWLEEHSYLTDYVVWARRIGSGEWRPSPSQGFDVDRDIHHCWFDADARLNDKKTYSMCGYERCAAEWGRLDTTKSRIPRRLFDRVYNHPTALYPNDGDKTTSIGCPFLKGHDASLAIMEAVIALAKESA